MTATPLDTRPGDVSPQSPLSARPAVLADNVDTNARVALRKEGVLAGIRRALNLHEGTNVTLTVTDDPTHEEVDVTITVASAAPSGSAGGALDGTYPNPGLAASVAGDGLTETSDVLAVGAGHAIDVTANAVDVDETELTYSILADALEGFGTIANGDTLDVDLGMVDTQPPGDQTIPANYAAYVPGEQGYRVASGSVLNIGSNGLLQVGLPAQPRTWTAIEDITLTADGPIGFTIPQLYTHFMIVGHLRGNAASTGNVYLFTINGDTSASYDYEVVDFSSAVVSGAASAASTSGRFGYGTGNSATANKFSAFKIEALNYRNTNFHRNIVGFDAYNDAGVAGQLVDFVGATYRSTAAVERIDLHYGAIGTGWKSGSTATLMVMS